MCSGIHRCKMHMHITLNSKTTMPYIIANTQTTTLQIPSKSWWGRWRWKMPNLPVHARLQPADVVLHGHVGVEHRPPPDWFRHARPLFGDASTAYNLMALL